MVAIGSEVVVLPLARYDELLESETRLDTVKDYLDHTEYIHHKDLYLLLGNMQKVVEMEQIEAMKLELYKTKAEREGQCKE